MFTKNIFNQKPDALVDLINNINEADYKLKVEALKGDQVKLDKNKNNKLDADDFKILRKEKKVNEEQIEEALRTVSTHGKGQGQHHAVVKRDAEWNEYQVHFYKDGKHMGEGPVSHHDDKADAQSTAEHEVKRMNAKNEAVSPFDWKNRPSELKKKPGETTGHDSKKTSTGTVYTKKAPKKPVEEEFDLESIDPALVEDFMQTEEFEQLDELSKKTLKSYVGKAVDRVSDTQFRAGKHWEKGNKSSADYESKETLKRMRGIHKATGRMAKEEVEQTDEAATLQPKGPARVDVPAYKRINMKPLSLKDVVNKSTEKKSNRPNAVKEESEQLDELSKKTLGDYVKKASHDVAHKGALTRQHSIDSRVAKDDQRYTDARKSDDKANKTFTKSWKRREGMAKAVDRLTKEEVQSIDERELTSGETAEKERIVKGMKKGLAGFKSRYGSRAKEVMYATATKKAKE